MAKVLILEQSKSMRNTLRERLEFEGFATAVALREEVSESLCARRGYDAIVAGGATEDVAALGVPFIIISSSGTIEGAVEAVRSGAIPRSRHESFCELYEVLKAKKKW